MLIDLKKFEFPKQQKLLVPIKTTKFPTRYEWQHQSFLSQISKSLISDNEG